MRLSRSALVILLAVVIGAALHALDTPTKASASSGQLAIIEDDNHLLADPVGTLRSFRKLGAQVVRLFVYWNEFAPNWHSTREPENFNGADPASYPSGVWGRWDAVAREAEREGIALDFVVTGASPRWADGPGIPTVAAGDPHRAWYPSPAKFGAFVRAVGTRYSGSYPDPEDPGRPLPRVSFWSIWNEPNFGQDLGPGAIKGSTVLVAPRLYRNLVAAAWKALGATGHGRDTILIGSLAARGLTGRITAAHPQGLPGQFGQTKPLVFVRALYCVGPHYRQLRGSAARALGCPTTVAGSRRFRAQNPGLFAASGFGDHPYPGYDPPNRDSSRDPNFATLQKLPNLEAALDRALRIYGSQRRLPVYNDEFGYITHPPNRSRYPSPASAAYYLNWAEYLGWRSRRLVSTAQYLLYDPEPTAVAPGGGFASGLLTASGAAKPSLQAYRLPVYLPVTSARRGRRLEVWGCVRPADYAAADTRTAQYVRIQLQRGSPGPFRTIQTVRITNPRGYFDTRVRFPTSGTVRLTWSYPAGDPLLPSGVIHSRQVAIKLR